MTGNSAGWGLGGYVLGWLFVPLSVLPAPACSCLRPPFLCLPRGPLPSLLRPFSRRALACGSGFGRGGLGRWGFSGVWGGSALYRELGALHPETNQAGQTSVRSQGSELPTRLFYLLTYQGLEAKGDACR